MTEHFLSTVVPIRINLTGNTWQNTFCFRSACVPDPILYPLCIHSIPVLIPVLFPFCLHPRSRSLLGFFWLVLYLLYNAYCWLMWSIKMTILIYFFHSRVTYINLLLSLTSTVKVLLCIIIATNKSFLNPFWYLLSLLSSFTIFTTFYYFLLWAGVFCLIKFT